MRYRQSQCDVVLDWLLISWVFSWKRWKNDDILLCRLYTENTKADIVPCFCLVILKQDQTSEGQARRDWGWQGAHASNIIYNSFPRALGPNYTPNAAQMSTRLHVTSR